jgi:ASC-1-like (ASCH) protein
MRITFFYKKESFESLKENFFRLTLDFHDSQQQAAAVGEMVFFSQPLDLVVSFLRKYVQYSTVFF